MIDLIRKKDQKWIFQKNVSSSALLKAYAQVVSDNVVVDKAQIKQKLTANGTYIGRSSQGSISTMGVRLSEMCFYMFGYKTENNIFMPSETTKNILESTVDVGKNMLVNLFSLQFPHPYSKTPDSFCIHAGRLLVKLLTEDRIGKKLYVDEMIWFLPFICTIDKTIYEELVESILEYRKLTYFQKTDLFHSVDNWEDIFANCMHEINYYFIRIFEGFHVFETHIDASHNDGCLFSFRHGNTKTFRKDSIESKGELPGYICLEKSLIESANKLLEVYSFLDKPATLKDGNVFSRSQWIFDLYETDIVKYLHTILPKYNPYDEILTVINNMTYLSKYSAVDGKEFENSLKPFFELFDEVIGAEIISGSGDTDLLCSIKDKNTNDIFKINIDAKSRNSVFNMNVKRLIRHLDKHFSKYCIVVAPRFSIGNKLDIAGERVVMITAEALAAYCSKECLSRKSYTADFNSLNEIIVKNLGKDITPLVQKLTESRYGYQLR